jgi:hypothetical protein
MYLLWRVGYHPRATRAYQTTHTTWEYIHAWRRAARCKMVPHGLYICATVLPSPKEVRGNVIAMGCARYPPRFSPPSIACGAEGGMSDFPTTTCGAAPTRPPEGVFRLILRKKYRRAVGTHDGQTRIRQAEYSLCHRRDGRAGTAVPQLVSASYNRTKALSSDY